MPTRLIGQLSAEAALARAIAQGRVSHAYLFIGPHHVGKQTAALLFAQALNCSQELGSPAFTGKRLRSWSYMSRIAACIASVVDPLLIGCCGLPSILIGRPS